MAATARICLLIALVTIQGGMSYGAKINGSSNCRYYCAYASQVYCCDDGSLTRKYGTTDDPPDENYDDEETDLTELQNQKLTRDLEKHRDSIKDFKPTKPKDLEFALKKLRVQEKKFSGGLQQKWTGDLLDEESWTDTPKPLVRRKRVRREAEAAKQNSDDSKLSKRRNKVGKRILPSTIWPLSLIPQSFIPTLLPFTPSAEDKNLQDPSESFLDGVQFREPPPLGQDPYTPTLPLVRYFELPETTKEAAVIEEPESEEEITEIVMDRSPPNFESLAKDFPLFESAVQEEKPEKSDIKEISVKVENIEKEKTSLESNEILKRVIPLSRAIPSSKAIPLSTPFVPNIIPIDRSIGNSLLTPSVSTLPFTSSFGTSAHPLLQNSFVTPGPSFTNTVNQLPPLKQRLPPIKFYNTTKFRNSLGQQKVKFPTLRPLNLHNSLSSSFSGHFTPGIPHPLLLNSAPKLGTSNLKLTQFPPLSLKSIHHRLPPQLPLATSDFKVPSFPPVLNSGLSTARISFPPSLPVSKTVSNGLVPPPPLPLHNPFNNAGRHAPRFSRHTGFKSPILSDQMKPPAPNQIHHQFSNTLKHNNALLSHNKLQPAFHEEVLHVGDRIRKGSVFDVNLNDRFNIDSFKTDFGLNAPMKDFPSSIFAIEKDPFKEGSSSRLPLSSPKHMVSFSHKDAQPGRPKRHQTIGKSAHSSHMEIFSNGRKVTDIFRGDVPTGPREDFTSPRHFNPKPLQAPGHSSSSSKTRFPKGISKVTHSVPIGQRDDSTFHLIDYARPRTVSEQMSVLEKVCPCITNKGAFSCECPALNDVVIAFRKPNTKSYFVANVEDYLRNHLQVTPPVHIKEFREKSSGLTNDKHKKFLDNLFAQISDNIMNDSLEKHAKRHTSSQPNSIQDLFLISLPKTKDKSVTYSITHITKDELSSISSHDDSRSSVLQKIFKNIEHLK